MTPNPDAPAVESGVWRPSQAKAAQEPYRQLGQWTAATLGKLAPSLVVIETPSGGQRHSATQLMAYAQAIGVIQGVAVALGFATVRVPVQRWKGNAPKGAALLTANVIRPPASPVITDHNQADAVALAYWWLRLGRNIYATEVQRVLSGSEQRGSGRAAA